MTRVPVPDDYERGVVTVAGSADYHYGEAQVNLDHRERARNLQVAEDDDGRYVGAPEWCADAVAEFLGTDADGGESDADEDEGNDGGETYTCAGKGGECTREVDEDGEYCWQHAEG